MSKHKFETIFHSDLGVAYYCASNGELHIGFASFLLIFYPTNFNSFVRNLEEQLRRRIRDEDPVNRKNIIIPTPIREVSLLLSLEELVEFVGFLREIRSKVTQKELAKNVLRGKNGISLN
ncbi:MAG: DUF6686 family protein [Bacteroidota bacterium]